MILLERKKVLKSIKQFFYSLKHLPLNCNDIIEGNITTLNDSFFLDRKLKGAILDLDNTIMLPHAAALSPETIQWIEKFQAFGVQLIVVTNNVNDKYLDKVEKILDQYNLTMLRKACKPNTHKLQEALDILNLDKNQICIIGDRVLTDIWGGKNFNIHTVLVHPLIGKKEKKLYKFLRKIEYAFLS